jgi:hypothetical protein
MAMAYCFEYIALRSMMENIGEAMVVHAIFPLATGWGFVASL